MNKKDINYENAECYDLALFSVEDYKEYKDVINSIPYDPELARFFHEERRRIKREDAMKLRHHGFSIDNAAYELDWADKAPEEIVMQDCELNELKEAVSQALTAVEFRRFSAWYFEGLFISEIAKLDGISEQAVTKSIRSAKKKLEVFLKKVVFDGSECRR